MENATIRTFGRTHGKRLSTRQKWLVNNMLPKLSPLTTMDIANIILEIGFGSGEHLIELAANNPDKIILGAEPFINGVASLLSRITTDKNELLPQFSNIRIFADDVRKLFTAATNTIFNEIYILHPDPWPKARHEKRRLLSSSFLKLLSSFIAKDGTIIIGTDHTDYYNWILEQVKQTNLEIKSTDVPTIKTKYQTKNMFGSPKTMYLILGQKL